LNSKTKRNNERGFTLLEGLVVMTILSITAVVASSLALERIRSARIRLSAEQFAIDLRAARLKAVSNRSPVDVIISTDPTNAYEYSDGHGRLRQIRMPPGVQIVSSDSTISFQPNGSILGGTSTIFETELSGLNVERWTVTTSVLGNPRTTHYRVAP
jgi:prepilin-type N-terminal cleavage/methylation domain-containing protein